MRDINDTWFLLITYIDNNSSSAIEASRLPTS